ncbi:outer membrane beta-barrel protein [Nostoc sp. FACHB-973]|uniref:Outer membrane beta-barrel protein n=1 Tax=Desmonostoc muscorum LEGE 12446 TaxID=1828758 RepID=A0A8J6ZJP2_DESMC|nr:outer membrane beta-barrel protein [Desmonostoc muscorum]MBD2513903.1 outer membrane beta-barrel protein [Nostoc sp. FACHB-973]MBX9255593.1 outer membrane beta-barrel protein [Desmonostoc muscorum CCALA 125]MCF2148204.1 outer membrane beta-barrel protein [Desmonostoc muscorum LEGE 12446]
MKLTKLAASAIAVASIILSGGIASAQTAGTNGNYIGAGIAAGATSGGQGNDDAQLGGNVQARYAVPKTPLSVRGSVLYGGDAAAIMPIVTYDAPIAKNTNVYFGGGYSFVTDEGQNSPLGNRNAPVVTLGVESEVTNNVIAYGDTKWGIDAYRNSDADAVSFQAGLGYRF